jgi:hypothetical protein
VASRPDPFAVVFAVPPFIATAVFAAAGYVCDLPWFALPALTAAAITAAALGAFWHVPLIEETGHDRDVYALAAAITCKRCGPLDWAHCTCTRECGSERCTGGWVAEWERALTATEWVEPHQEKD